MKGCKNRYIPLLVSTSALPRINKDKKGGFQSLHLLLGVYPNVRGSEEVRAVEDTAAPRAGRH